MTEFRDLESGFETGVDSPFSDLNNFHDDVNSPFVGRKGYEFQLFYEETTDDLPQNSKLATLVAEGGVFAYGVFWGLVDLLASQGLQVIHDKDGGTRPFFNPYPYAKAVKKVSGWQDSNLEGQISCAKHVNLAVMAMVKHEIFSHEYFIDGHLLMLTRRLLRLIDYTLPHNPPRDYRQYAHEIYERDGQKCVYCGSPHNLSLDHFVPQSKGGTHDKANLVTACRSCNSSKGDRLFGDWLKSRNFRA